MMKRICTGILTIFSLATVAAFAQSSGTPTTSTPVTGQTIQDRKDNQQKRIGEGLENGSLTAGEAGKLENKEKKLNKEERNDRAANGGKLTQGEKTKINRQQNRVSKQIYNKKHNGRKRG